VASGFSRKAVAAVRYQHQAATALTLACFTRVRGARCSRLAVRTPFQIAPAIPADRTRTEYSPLHPRFVRNATETTNSRPRACRGGLIISGAGGSCPCRLQWWQNSQYVRLLQARQVQHWRPQMVHFDFGVMSFPSSIPFKDQKG
jgi:hypothetical protein